MLRLKLLFCYSDQSETSTNREVRLVTLRRLRCESRRVPRKE
jgi:hypothetical protein